MVLDILATGYPSLDRIFRVDHAPLPGETGVILDAPKQDEVFVGGCVGNVAVACARLGLAAGVAIVLGDDAQGHRYQAALASAGVDTRGIQFVAGARSPYCFLFIEPGGRHQTLYYPGVSDRADITLALPDSLVSDVRWGVITVGNAAHNRAVASCFTRQRIPILWALKGDAHAYPRPLVEYLASVSRVVVMNEEESQALQTLLGLRSLRELFRRGVQAIVLTLGARGSRVMQPGHVFEIPAVQPEELVDPTGAGDAFTAGLLYGLGRGLGLETGARIGAVVASFVLEEWGSQTNLPCAAQVRERYRATFAKGMES